MALAGRAQISNDKDGLISLEVNDEDPKFAATLANGYVAALEQLLSSLAVTEAQQRRAFIEKQLASTKDNLVNAEHALRSTGISGSTLKLSGSAVASLAQFKAAITAQEIKLASMRGYLTELAPEFKQAQVEMSVLRSQLARLEKDEPANAGDDSGYVAKYRNFKYYETLLELFAKQYDVARIDESREGVIIQVLNVAEPPTKRTSAKRTQTAVSASLSVGVALLLFVFIRNALKRAAQRPETSDQIESLRRALARSLGRS
jgi:uncharacterized protein involved in exopolysaccharide biosynthesis